MNARENRFSWKKMFVEIAKVVAQRSADPHTQVGAVLVKDNRIISCGYNGDLLNSSIDINWATSEKYQYCVHAEMNALANALRNGVNVSGADAYLTVSPCNTCIKLLIQSGIKNIYYISEYKDFELVKYIAESSNVNLIKVSDELN